MMKVRRFNSEGIKKIGEFLDSLNAERPIELPEHFLADPEFSELVKPEVEIEQQIFKDRFDAADYMNKQFGNIGIEDLLHDRGIWSWLAIFYFDQLCPISGSGKRKPGAQPRWIPVVGDFRTYYRHLLAGPFRIFRAHRNDPERVRVLLCNPLHSPGEIAEQLASRQELVTNPSVMEVATQLYLNPETRKPKRGAASKNKGGTARRLAEVLNQFDLTWDLYFMSPEALLNMLPAEFERFSSI
jgi:hypothetical protein